MTDHAEGGHIPGPSGNRDSVPTWISWDECVLWSPREGTEMDVCIRTNHPTPVSDCATLSWVRHMSDYES